jgi:hypothetical protein
MTLKYLLIPVAIGVIVYGWHRNDLRRLIRDYACKEPFHGALEACIIRFPLDEEGTDAVLGANGEGLYLSSSADALDRNRRWAFRYYAIRTPIFIPWGSIRIHDARFPMRKYLRFNVRSSGATFFVPREAGRRLLGNAGRTLSPG